MVIFQHMRNSPVLRFLWLSCRVGQTGCPVSSFDPWTPNEKSASLSYEKAKQKPPQCWRKSGRNKERTQTHLSGKCGNVQFY